MAPPCFVLPILPHQTSFAAQRGCTQQAELPLFLEDRSSRGLIPEVADDEKSAQYDQYSRPKVFGKAGEGSSKHNAEQEQKRPGNERPQAGTATRQDGYQ